MKKTIAIIGGGPAGLMAAEILSEASGADITIYERKPTVGRKFLMAGRGGLNLTHSEHIDEFIGKYDARAGVIGPLVRSFTPQALRAWCAGLGEDTFIGSSGRVFPKSFKASPLLRAWIARLEGRGVKFAVNYDWRGWDHDRLVFESPAAGSVSVLPDAALLCLGGASWPRLGSDGSWVDILRAQGVGVATLCPSNCGFVADWSPVFSERFSGLPLKTVELSFQGRRVRGEFIITRAGVEGGAIYALSAPLRQEIYRNKSARLNVDLKPDLDMPDLVARLEKPRRGLSMANYLRKHAGLSDVAIGLLMERPDRKQFNDYSAARLAGIIKNHEIELRAPFSIESAISSAGGVTFDSVDEHFMLLKKPGIFVAGEMLDWEAPTGGYLLQACMASGVHAANGIIKWLRDS